MEILQMTFNVTGQIKYSAWAPLRNRNEQIIDTYSNNITFQMR